MVALRNSFPQTSDRLTQELPDEHILIEHHEGQLHYTIDCAIKNGKLITAHTLNNDGIPEQITNEEIALNLSFECGKPIKLFEKCYKAPNGHDIDKTAQINMAVLDPITPGL